MGTGLLHGAYRGPKNVQGEPKFPPRRNYKRLYVASKFSTKGQITFIEIKYVDFEDLPKDNRLGCLNYVMAESMTVVQP